jgi:hypothetical protein
VWLFLWAFSLSLGLMFLYEHSLARKYQPGSSVVHDQPPREIVRPLSFACLGIAGGAVLIYEGLRSPYGIASKVCVVAAGFILAGEADIVLQQAQEKVRAL